MICKQSSERVWMVGKVSNTEKKHSDGGVKNSPFWVGTGSDVVPKPSPIAFWVTPDSDARSPLRDT